MKTIEQARAELRQQGITITEFAERNGLPRDAVSNVLNGKTTGHYGDAHRAAVLLGIKEVALHDALDKPPLKVESC